MTKKCFIICPIGEDGSPTRKHSDQVTRHILDPVFEKRGFEMFNAADLPTPGVITTQIMKALLNSDLVVADLSEHNPNVFYELAIRHATGKPYIQIIDSEARIPFDVAGIRTIKFNLNDLDSVDLAKKTLKRQLDEIENGYVPDSPISPALAASLFEGNENAIAVFLEKFWNFEEEFERLHKRLDEVADHVDDIHSEVSMIESTVSDIEKKLDAE